MSPNFVSARAKHHALMKSNAEKSRKIMAEFLKMQEGQVSGRVLEKIARQFGISASHHYSEVKSLAGIDPNRKHFVKRNKPIRKLVADFVFLLKATPEKDLPTTVKLPQIAPPKPAPAPEVEPATEAYPFSDVRDMSSDLLLAATKEFIRRAEVSIKIVQLAKDTY